MFRCNRKRKAGHGVVLPLRTKKIKRNAPLPFTIEADPTDHATIPDSVLPVVLPTDLPLDPVPLTEDSLATMNLLFDFDSFPGEAAPLGDSSLDFFSADLARLRSLAAEAQSDNDDLVSLFDQPAYSTIDDQYELAPLALFARPISKQATRSIALTQVRLAWMGDLEDLLDRTLKPQLPVMEWPQKLLKALAQLALYGQADEINGLLRNQVWARQMMVGGEYAVTAQEVHAVIDDMKKGQRQKQRPVWDDDEFSLLR
ncbi:hypothetical protein LTR36_008088 [Oleoguttula mirabilis]|uniref:Uncharacterized protein n=1 Tax=Oleoguttula mirabilis TaxID=1507867 RepID=A0AAV9JAA4_9PEZI|nr:hypothetical protein LTR36_008088 [Oleoguttula mirabilis]